MSTSFNGFAMIGEGMTHLVHHIDKGLCVIPEEGFDHVTLVLARDDRLEQGGEFVRSECASDQTSTD